MHKHTPHCCTSLIPFNKNNKFVGINSHESIRLNLFVPVQPLQTWLFCITNAGMGVGAGQSPQSGFL